LGPERVLIFELRQVRLYLHDPAVRAAAQDRAAAKVTEEPFVCDSNSSSSSVGNHV